MKKIQTSGWRRACLSAGGTVLFLAAVPFAAFYMMQFLLGGLPWEYSLSVALGNALCVGMIYYPLCALTGSPVLSGLTV